MKSLVFGMLQKSIWMSPLDIGQDLREVIYSIGLSKNAYVMEVSGFIFGDPRELARHIWHLDKLGEEYIRLKSRLDTIIQLIRNANDRINKREAKVRNKYIYDLERKKRGVMREYLEFVVKLPPLPTELLPISLRNAYSIFPK